MKITVEVLEWGTFLSYTGKGEADIFMLGWSSYTGDADYSLTSMIHSSMKGNPGNKTFYENKEVDTLLAEGRKEIIPEKRKFIYNKIQDIVNSEVPIFPIYFALASAGVRNEVMGFIQTPLNIPNFYKLSFISISH